MKVLRAFLVSGAVLGVLSGSPALASRAQALNSDAAQPRLIIRNPGEIIPAEDYPTASRRAGEEGTVVFKLWTDADGKVLDCQITTASGIKALDDQTCASIRLHGKFATSGAPNEADGRYSMSDTVRWALPTAPARALFLDTTLTGSQTAPDGRIRCTFSDGLVQYAAKGTPCVLDTPRQAPADGDGRPAQTIVDHYLQLYNADPKPDYAFNVAVILAAQQYGQSLDYLAKASDGGLGLASFVMCGLNATPNNSLMNVYDPKQAVRRCLLAHQQGFDLGMVLLRQVLIAHPDAASEEQRRFIETYQPSLPIATGGAVLTVPADTLIRAQDYPKSELKHKIQGRTSALFRIDTQGRVQDCLIVESSLSYAMDETVCRRLREAAIYTPATLLGQPAAVWKTQAVAWQIGHDDKVLGGTIFGALLGAIVGHAL